MQNIPLFTALFVGMSIGSAMAVNVTNKQGSITIIQANQHFSEDAIKVKTGDTIYFNNADTVTHNIQISNAAGDTDDKGLQKPGEILQETFSEAGEYKAHCGIHPGMKMKITVQ